MGDEKQPPTLEHQEPPVYYCWKYWMSNGEIREGCTPIEPSGHDTWPDLNDYGWVYIAVPVAIVFVLIFLVYLICSKTGKKKSVQKQSLLLEESDSEDDMPPPTRSKWARVQSYQPHETVQAVPVKKANLRDFATIVHMAKPDNNAAPDRKVPPRGGVTAPMYTHDRVYPQLSTKNQRGVRADEVVTVDGTRMHAKSTFSGPSAPPLNHYVNNPTAGNRKNRQNTSDKVVEELDSSSDDDITTDNEIHSEDENAK